MKEFIMDLVETFIAFDSTKWRVKHWIIYSTLTILLAVQHGVMLAIARLIFNI